MIKEFLKEYNHQLTMFKRNVVNFDINDFNFTILSDEKNKINKMLKHINIDELKNELDDSNINSFLDAYLCNNEIEKDFEPIYNNISFYDLNNEKFKPYTSKEEKEIFQKYNEEKNPAKKKKIRNEIIEHNILLTRKIARRYENFTYMNDLNDLIDIGTLGLMKAIDKFDINRGLKFSTYATYWINQAISRETINFQKNIRIPIAQNEKINRVKNATIYLTSTLKKNPTKKEIADYLNISIKELDDIKLHDSIEISFNMPVNDDSDTTFEELLLIPQKSVEDVVLSSELHKLIRDYIINNFQSKKNIDILLMRFGFEPYERAYSLEEIVNKYGISRQRVSQIELNGVKKIKYYLKRHGIIDIEENEDNVQKIITW